jgi:hypothetical protein
MPIPVDRLKQAQRPVRERILEFLSQHPDQAFTAAEIYVALEGLDEKTGPMTLVFMNSTQRSRLLQPLVVATEELIQSGKLTAAPVQGTTYYAVVR